MKVTSLNTARMLLGSAPKHILDSFKEPKKKVTAAPAAKIASAPEKELEIMSEEIIEKPAVVDEPVVAIPAEEAPKKKITTKKKKVED